MDKTKYIGDTTIKNNKIKAIIKQHSVILEHIEGTETKSIKALGRYEYDTMMAKIPNGADRLQYILYTTFGVSV